ncbi:MAG: acyltransferase [Chthoniobacter sp.]|nr:acyltransferase [Chthoniobacter sp.]
MPKIASATAGKVVAPRLQELDVLRGIAAVSVTFFHYAVRYHWMENPNGPPPNVAVFGESAVHLFFMISGFVIFMTLAKTRTALDFVVSRFSRLYPVYWAAVLVTFAVTAVMPLPGRTPGLGQLLANLTMLQRWLNVPDVDGVYWTLAVELSFYAIMLAVFLAGWLRQIERFVIPWLLAELGWAYLKHRYDLPKVVEISLLLKFAHLFLAGIVFYRLRFEGPTRTRYLLLACCFAVHCALNGPVAAAFAVIFFAAFLALAADRLAWIAIRPLVFCGTISYSLYLVHQNIGFVVMRAMGGLPRFVQIGSAAAVVLLLASVLTIFVEKPALRAIRAFYKRHSARRVATLLPAEPQP